MARRTLAFIAAASLTAVSSATLAQTETTANDPARVFTDPNFLPTEGMLYGTTGYSYGWLTGDNIDSTGAKSGDAHVDSQTISQLFGYGITDDFAVIVSDSYVPLAHRSVDPASGPSFDRDRSGFTDPSFEAIYRVLDERTNPVLLDLFASYSPDLIDAHGADAAHEGTVARGGDEAAFGVALGREWDDFALRGTARAEWLDNRTSGAASGPGGTQEDSSWNYGLDLTSQYRFDNVVSANLGVGYDMHQSFDTAHSPSGATFVTHPGNVGNLHAALNYQLIPNRAAASLVYQYNDYASRSVDNTGGGGADSATRNRTENVLGVKFDYALN